MRHSIGDLMRLRCPEDAWGHRHLRRIEKQNYLVQPLDGLHKNSLVRVREIN